LTGAAHIICDDSRKVLAEAARRGAQVHSIVTDPPYGLVSIVKRFGKEGSAPAKSNGATGVFSRTSRDFLGQVWDGAGIERDPTFWRLCYDLLPPGGHVLAFGSPKTVHRTTCALEDAGFEIRESVIWVYVSGMAHSHEQKGEWVGWETGLKGAHEVIIVARKPLQGSVQQNLDRHRVGAYNVAACPAPGGRWPANVMVEEQAQDLLSGKLRYFFSPKASRADRGPGNPHPTVKPTDLMAYLCRLVTPPGGIVLDPFMGSGSTGKAAVQEGFHFIGIDASPTYTAVARSRIAATGAEVTSKLETLMAEATAAAERMRRALG